MLSLTTQCQLCKPAECSEAELVFVPLKLFRFWHKLTWLLKMNVFCLVHDGHSGFFICETWCSSGTKYRKLQSIRTIVHIFANGGLLIQASHRAVCRSVPDGLLHQHGWGVPSWLFIEELPLIFSSCTKFPFVSPAPLFHSVTRHGPQGSLSLRVSTSSCLYDQYKLNIFLCISFKADLM